MVFGIIPECRSDSFRNSVQLRRNPQYATVSAISGAGAVQVMYGSYVSNGLTGGAAGQTGNQVITADSIGLGGQAGAHFGAALY